MNEAAPLVTPAVPTNPFPGLRPFREDEEYLFFGRENQVDAMVDKLVATRFLAVVGTSGCGKSSLVNCGLRPALRQGLMARAGAGWRMAQFRPGADPIGAMARALAEEGVLFARNAAKDLPPADIVETTLRMSKEGLIDIFEQARLDDGVNLLVVADQFEELFRYRKLAAAGRDVQRIGDDAAAFVNLLLEVKQQTACPIFVVLTMRSDFLGDCAEFPGLAEAINAGLYLVPRLTRDERRAAIEGPVRVGGAEIAPVLLTRLVNDVGDNSDQLSILQHALNRTWARWQDEGEKGPLDLRHYEAIGTMARALDQHAEQAYSELGAERLQQVCERLFKALTDKATDPRGVRRPTSLRDLCALTDATEAEVIGVIDVFRDPSRAFLMPSASEALQAKTVIDISHESLMRVWRRLDGWAEDEAGSARLYRRLAETAALHAKGAASLWRDPELQLALDWRDNNHPNVTWASRYHPGFASAMDFLTQSHQAEARRTSEERRRLAEIAAARRRTTFAVTVIMLAVCGLAWAIWQARDTEKREILVTTSLADKANRDGYYDRAMRVALQGLPRPGALPWSSGWSSVAVRGLEAKLAGSAMLSRHVARMAHEGRVRSAAFSPDGARVVTASWDNTARVWDAASGQEIASLKGHEDRVWSAAFSPNGARVVTASDDRTARVWDAASGQEIASLRGHEGTVVSAAFSPDGARIVTASWDKTARVWDAASGQQIASLKGHEGFVWSAAFSPDGARIVTASDDKTARVWHAASGQEIAPLKGHEDSVWSAAFSPGGARIITASADRTARVWDAATGQQIASLKGHDDFVSSVAFSPDGARIVTASADRTARVWDAASGQQIASLKGHEGLVQSAAFSPDGARIVTASADTTAGMWDAASGQQIASLKGHEDTVWSAAFSPDGARIVTASDDKTARVWDAASGQQIANLKGHEDRVWSAAFSPDGARVVTASDDKTARVWDAASGQELASLKGHEGPVRSAAFSPDGARIVTASDDKTARVWDAASGQQMASLKGHEDSVASAAFSPDGARIVTASADRTARVWHAASGREIAPLKGHEDSVWSAAFSPDGARIVTASADRTARVWDAASGQQSASLKGHQGPVWSVAFSPGGTRIVTASDDRTARVWDAASGQEIATLKGHEGPVVSAAFSPGGTRIVTASNDRTARVWDAASGQKMASLKGHEDSVASAAFSPDGARIVTASNDRTARVWDAASGQEIASLNGHERLLVSAAFGPDGARIVTASADRTARVWDVRWAALVRGEDLRDLVCREKLKGAEAFSVADASDPILSGLEGTRPCGRTGPLSLRYWAEGR